MADFENNVVHLATVRINERNRKIAFEVAADLTHFVLREVWVGLSARKKQTLVRPYANHLWGNYKSKLRASYSHEEAARQAMLEELSALEKQFTLGDKE